MDIGLKQNKQNAMDVGTDEANPAISGHCKSLMNFFRRAFSFREKKPKEETNGAEGNLTELEVEEKERLKSLTSNDAASTSFTPQLLAPSVYEDPFVAVTADGLVHIKHYFVFNKRIEFHLEDIHLPHMKHTSRVVDVSKIKILYYASGSECTDENKCKTWGMTRNDVWWASHLNRLEQGNLYTNVVLEEGSTIRPGFSVCSIEAFAEGLQCVGLPKESPFQPGLPSPPFSVLEIPFIDEEGANKTQDGEGTSGSSSN